MSFYYLKNLKIDKENNNFSADLADSCWTPIEYFHVNNLFEDKTYEENYARLMYDFICGNFHPNRSNKYSKLVMNNLFSNYYQDSHDIGILNTYHKYEDVINGILSGDKSKCIKLESDRTLNPEQYYVLTPVTLENKIDTSYYENKRGDLYCIQDKELMLCSKEGEPLSLVYYDLDKFKEHNDFLTDKDSGMEL